MGNICSTRDENDMRQQRDPRSSNSPSKAQNVFKTSHQGISDFKRSSIFRQWTPICDRVEDVNETGCFGEHLKAPETARREVYH